MPITPELARITDRLRDRSHTTRSAYLSRIEAAAAQGRPFRGDLGCANLAHGVAACAADDKAALMSGREPNIAIVTAYNDMLSAHQPYERFPGLIKAAIRGAGGVAQVAGGVPAMCDGITQGRAAMELSLFSRDVIALSTAVALSHDMFDGALLLGICDKIVPGLLIGALSFGHLPVILVPSGPMVSGLSNAEKSRVRQAHAAGTLGKDALLQAEAASYHAPGTCTFYGTANSNQVLMEMMGLHLPGASFVNPNTPLRDALTAAAAERVLALTALAPGYLPMGLMVDERVIVNAVVGLLASGGSTNHTLHLVAIAAAAGIRLNWDDFAALSAITPSLMRIYPNGTADINAFHRAGGMAFLMGTLLDAGLLHGDVPTIAGPGGLEAYRQVPVLTESGLIWQDGPRESGDKQILTGYRQPFSGDGGLKLLTGTLGQAVIKISAVKPEHRVIEAPALVFPDQAAVLAAFAAGALHRDVVVVVRFQGPKANGMPELHKLTPALSVLLDLGFRVALVTDGRMSGASGKVPAALHVTPEAAAEGPLARLRDGDVIRVDAESGRLEVLVEPALFAEREPIRPDLTANGVGTGRELFSAFRRGVGPADQGASIF